MRSLFVVAAAFSSSSALAQNFGDDTGEFANDGECDDSRFEGAGVAEYLTDEHVGHDATDCQRLLAQGSVTWRADMLAECALDQWAVQQEGLTCLLTERHVVQKGDVRQTPYVNGRPHGLATYRKPNGEIASKTPWVNGRRHGTQIEQFENEQGVAGRHETNFAHGQRQLQITIWDNGHRRETSYHTSGIRSKEVYLWPQDSSRRGQWDRRERAFNADGQLHGNELYVGKWGRRKETPYVDGVIQGTVIERRCESYSKEDITPSFITDLEIPYVDGSIHGLRVEVSLTIQMITQKRITTRREQRFVNGERHGTGRYENPYLGIRDVFCYANDELVRKSKCRAGDLR